MVNRNINSARGDVKVKKACAEAAVVVMHEQASFRHHDAGKADDKPTHSKAPDTQRLVIAQAYKDLESFEAWQANTLSAPAAQKRKDPTSCSGLMQRIAN